jgi:GNAT superfamily N-acetyltransferase
MGELTSAEEIEEVGQEDIVLSEGVLGYNINVHGEHVGAIEAVPGQLEYIEIEMHWEGKGVARAALNEFIDLSREYGESEVTTNNATHPAMEHILETEGFEKKSGDLGWVKQTQL